MYRISEKNTLGADQTYWTQDDVAYIAPDMLYPAWSGLLTENTGNKFTDSSASAHVISSGRTVNHSGAMAKIGSTSMKFDGAVHAPAGASSLNSGLPLLTNHITIPDSADWDLATSTDFTIEFWYNPSRVSDWATVFGMGMPEGSSTTAIVCGHHSNTNLVFEFNDNGTYYTAVAPTPGTWYHIALTRTNNDTLKIYVDGTLTTTPTNLTFNAPTNTLSIGGNSGDFSREYRGFLDEFRIVKGTGVYTGNFTPPTALTTTGGTYASGTNVNTSFTASHTKLLIHSDNGGHLGAYGTEQADGKKYYYTDIKGSKPINDPRIGSYFGGQRYMLTSLQKLEQETAIHEDDVYSVDGREWMRFVSGDGFINYSNNGHQVRFNSLGMFLEIVSYFNGANYGNEVETGTRAFEVRVDGALAHTDLNTAANISSPLGARWLDGGSIQNIDLTSSSKLTSDTSLGIHTLRLSAKWASGSNNISMTKIELIAQDKTSTATKSQIQIPSQNVVSYGKKFTVSGTPHYNPFAFAGDGTTAVAIGNTTSHGKVADGWTGSTATYFDSSLDTATSLGLAAWETGGDFYRPVNGGRIVKWVDSSGNIKTSVNMMPPCATAVVAGSDASLPTSHAWTTVYKPMIKSGAVDHSQSEVAKTFHFREFGNGGGNQTYAGTNPDASQMHSDSTEDDIAYVMDDGITSLSGNDVRLSGRDFVPGAASTLDHWYLSFIGTGVTIYNGSPEVTYTIGQNLPYGSHILKCIRGGSDAVHKIDGVTVTPSIGTSGSWRECTFHQPKMPPIPKNAVVLTDYMLMADFVKQSETSADIEGQISKGVRYISGSRDHYCNGAAAFASHSTTPQGLIQGIPLISGTGDNTGSVQFFGTTAAFNVTHSNQAFPCLLNGSAATETKLDNTGASAHFYDAITISETVTVSQTSAQTTMPGGQYYLNSTHVATPTHTSSHYQPFETPYLTDLVGGDRNIEQTNLVVTADGKTWDQVTRNTSYLGNSVLCIGNDTLRSDHVAHTTGWDTCRGEQGSGGTGHKKMAYWKDSFCLAYDRFVCLKAGSYAIHIFTMSYTGGVGADHGCLLVNGVHVAAGHTSNAGVSHCTLNHYVHLDRGDYVQVSGRWYGSHAYSGFWIDRI